MLGYKLPEVKIVWSKSSDIARSEDAFIYVADPSQGGEVNVIDIFAQLVESKIMPDVRLVVDEPLASVVKLVLIRALSTSFVRVSRSVEREFLRFQESLRQSLPEEKRQAFEELLEKAYRVEEAGLFRTVWLFTVNFIKRRAQSFAFVSPLRKGFASKALKRFLVDTLYGIAAKSKEEDVPLTFEDEGAGLKLVVVLVAREEVSVRRHAEAVERYAKLGYNPVFAAASGSNVDRLRYMLKILQGMELPPYNRYESECKVFKGGKVFKGLVYAFEFHEALL